MKTKKKPAKKKQESPLARRMRRMDIVEKGLDEKWSQASVKLLDGEDRRQQKRLDLRLFRIKQSRKRIERGITR